MKKYLREIRDSCKYFTLEGRSKPYTNTVEIASKKVNSSFWGQKEGHLPNLK
jgi:hypothetical protein